MAEFNLGDEPHEGRPPLDTMQGREVRRRQIESDQIKRLRILDYLWMKKRKGKDYGEASSDEFKKVLGLEDENEIRFHLDTLADLLMLRIGHKVSGGYIDIEITGFGTTQLEYIFTQIEDAFSGSTDVKIQTEIKSIDDQVDVYQKHEKYITTMSTIGEGFKLGNKILSGLGL